MGKRAAVAVLLLAVAGVAGCGDGPTTPADLPMALQRAVEARDEAAYGRVLASVRERRPLGDRELDRLATALRGELLESIAWPDSYCPSALALIEGSIDPVRWLQKSYDPPKVAKELGAKLVRYPLEAPFLPANPRLIRILRNSLKSDDGERALWAARLLAYLRREDRLALAEDLIEATTHDAAVVGPQCRIALADLGESVVPCLVGAIRRDSERHGREMAWALKMMGEAAHEAVPELESLLDHADWDARRLAATALLHLDRANLLAREALLRDLVSNKDVAQQVVQWAITDELRLVEMLPRVQQLAERTDLDDATIEVIRETMLELRRLRAQRDGK